MFVLCCSCPFSQEALEVLRTVPDVVNLTVCRPRDEQYRKLSPPAEAPKPPQRNQPSSLPLYPVQMNFCGVSAYSVQLRDSRI